VSAPVSLAPAALLALALALPLSSWASASDEASFDYFYVEANEGGSSGGHSAVRLGAQVFHFSNRDGLLVLDREPTREFLHAYALLGNRDIHLSRVALRAPDRDRIARALDAYYRIQAQQLDVQAALREDRELIEGRFEDGSPIEVPALGYFMGFEKESAIGAPDGQASGAAAIELRELRARITASSGAEVLRGKRERALDQLAEALARDPAGWPFALPRDRSERPAFTQSYARRVVDAAANLAALDVLEHTPPLAGNATVEIEESIGRLTESERAVLAARREGLADELIRLAGSNTSDWGRPFLVGLARWLAADEGLRRGQLVLLDVLPDDGARLPARVVASRSDVVAEIRRAAREDLRRGRAVLDESEAAWSHLEEILSRLVELDRAADWRRDLRLARGALVPARSGVLRVAIAPPVAEREGLERAADRVRERERKYGRALDALYGYRLLTRNCVSELFQTMNDTLGGSPEDVRAALGGYVDGHSAFEYIPFVSARAVDTRYRVVLRREVPSWRALQLQEMRQRENPLWVALRESNTLTARSYRRGVRDSFFLFFTEDAALLRPLLGAFNLTAALGESAWGLPLAIVDDGDTLRSGLRGALTSLPELAFGNIRKGSNDWVASHAQPLDD
jgi:hypothetical protein